MITHHPIRRCKLIKVFETMIIMGVCYLFIFAFNYFMTAKSHSIELPVIYPKRTLKFVLFEKKPVVESINISNIKRLISKYNLEERILNLDTFGTVKEDTTVFVIFNNGFSKHLKYLIISLSQIQGIENALIIFSHSHFDENVNNLIMTIDFCRVIQIFYPHSVQVNPNEFPGYQPQDCPYDMEVKAAEAIQCVGASFPDIHGKYRNPSQTEQKHHWWWTANKVFENLTCTVNHTGTIFFSESNMFFSKDFLYLSMYMKTIAKSLNQCEFMSLGATTTDPSNNISDHVDIQTWDPEIHSGVLAFDIKVWNSIVSHYDLFCHVDDYSWYRSLYYVSLNRRDGNRFKVISSSWPRAFRISSCNNDDCEALEEHAVQLKTLQTINDDKSNMMYPPRLEVYINIELENDEYIIFDYVESNGGWNDPRDKALCNNMTVNKIRKVLIDMKNEFKDYKS